MEIVLSTLDLLTPMLCFGGFTKTIKTIMKKKSNNLYIFRSLFPQGSHQCSQHGILQRFVGMFCVPSS